MKRILAFSILLLALVTTTSFAQVRQTAKISLVKQKDKVVNFSILSDHPFRTSAQRYILHIGTHEFLQSILSESNGRGGITFMIPLADYKKLKQGQKIFLTYGHSNSDGDNLDDLVKQKDPSCWALGKFSKRLLTK